jgi:Heparinase II/III-like protein/Heparinase II/III N-terminus
MLQFWKNFPLIMSLKKIQLYFNTIKYLRWRQISYRVWYLLRNRWRKSTGFSYYLKKNTPLSTKPLFEQSIDAHTSFSSEKGFTFLNLTKKFDTEIDWEFADYGKLWTYNLTYFEFLNQNAQNTEGSPFLTIIEDFIKKLPQLKNATEPFPIALRGINWIKFFAKNNIQNLQYDRSLFHQYQILADNIEYHLLGNHLLENGFSMLFGAVYFQHKDYWVIAYKILSEELEEQILDDGAHFELCPMYHKIMLFRTLDCYNLLKNNKLDDPSVFGTNYKNLKQLLADKAGTMLGWLKNITYADGSTPHFGDSTDGIAPTSIELFDYAQRLNISPLSHPLSQSGFRKLKNDNFELFAKVCKIGPDYIPGHAHADSLSFELRIKNKPFLIETGISTYETNDRRQLERSTSNHNTVEVNGQNSSEVWGSFRVGNRANSSILIDTPTQLSAQHDGYKHFGTHHLRAFQLSENDVQIIDKIDKNLVSKASWHLPPTLSIQLKNNCIYFDDGKIEFLIDEKTNSSIKKIELADYSLPPQYNTFLTAQKIIVTFKGTLQTRIKLV